jgi:hypothetical protein
MEYKKSKMSEQEYDTLCQDYRIACIALDKLEPLSDLWCYYMQQKCDIEFYFYLIDEGDIIVGDEDVQNKNIKTSR